MWNRWTPLLTVLMMALPLVPLAQAGSIEVSIAVIDKQQAIAQSIAARSAQTMLKKKLDTRQKLVTEKEQELKALRLDQQQKSRLLTQDARDQLRILLSRKERDFQRFFEDSNRDQQAEVTRVTRRITNAVRDVIEDISRQRGYKLVLEKRMTAYADPSIDITDDVLAIVNERTKDWYQE
ncbi:outer membrane chaperone Skp (OmpH) [Magnetococcus marinus MC-1]|uniref:Outer membrane chaperone Skp (OmpH) n=1 Tax=Magnetococcus marinus (strain ATCC BAA-1437 / JCM 17883 / MC-1) TaxID=156889 RepID=A0L8R4_MAGMM|nr:OmpH family outer membrane protein [Magnetococcus marinus]ABK44357.1 outer membrane chaperone Skp (OmpH) [Magnetococcus marinus MC-1]